MFYKSSFSLTGLFSMPSEKCCVSARLIIVADRPSSGTMQIARVLYSELSSDLVPGPLRLNIFFPVAFGFPKTIRKLQTYHFGISASSPTKDFIRWEVFVFDAWEWI